MGIFSYNSDSSDDNNYPISCIYKSTYNTENDDIETLDFIYE